MNIINTLPLHQKCLREKTIRRFANGLIRLPGFVYINDHIRDCPKCFDVFNNLYRAVIARERRLVLNHNFAFAAKTSPGCLSPKGIEMLLESGKYGQIIFMYLNYHSSFCVRCNALLTLLLCYRENPPVKNKKGESQETLILLNVLDDNAILYLIGKDRLNQLKSEHGLSEYDPFVEPIVRANLRNKFYLSMEFQRDPQGKFVISDCDLKEIVKG